MFLQRKILFRKQTETTILYTASMNLNNNSKIVKITHSVDKEAVTMPDHPIHRHDLYGGRREILKVDLWPLRAHHGTPLCKHTHSQ